LPEISPHKTPELRPPEPSSVTDDQAWEAVKLRRPVGQFVLGKTVQVEPWGAFFDICERFPAFIEPLDLQEEKLVIGSRHRLKILQHADWNRQLRVMIAGPSE
jgi:hypothetical protein